MDAPMGYLLIRSLNRYESIRYIGVDHDDQRVSFAKKHQSKNGLCTFHNNTDILKSESIDTLVCNDVLYCIEDALLDAIIERWSTLIRPGGKLVLKEVVASSGWKNRLSIIQEDLAVNKFRLTKGTTVRLRSADYYNEICQRHGFEVIRQVNLSKHYPWNHYMFVYKK